METEAHAVTAQTDFFFF